MAAAIAAIRHKQEVKLQVEDQAKLNWQPELPKVRLADYTLEKYTGGGSDGVTGEWQTRRIVFSDKDLFFARVEDENVIDLIPLHEITKVDALGPKQQNRGSVSHMPLPAEEEAAEESEGGNSPLAKKGRHDSVMRVMFDHAFEIHTQSDGYNSGRVYVLRAKSDAERDGIVQELESVVKHAIKTFKNLSDFERSQERARAVFTSMPFQCTVAFLIFFNFITQAIDNQVWPEEGSTLQKAFRVMDIVFTALFSVELAINLYAHWCKRFFSDGWSIFDLIVVSISWISIFMDAIPGVSVLRVMRAFRVLRIFGRLKSLRQIINALSSSIVPVMNAFLILFIVTAIYAMVGINFFAERSDEHFGTFARAVMTMFLLTAGESWLPDMPPFREEDGEMDGGVIAFCVSFIVIVNWTLLQVTVAVLLDNFVAATAEEEKISELAEIEAHKTRKEINTLDPLLSFFVDHFDTNEDLSLRIQNLFRVLDVDGSGSLDHQEIIVGLRKIDASPRINVTLEDIEVYLHMAGLEPGMREVKMDSFERIIRSQLKAFTQRGVTDAMLATGRAGDNATNATLSSLKMLLLLTETQHASAITAVNDVRNEMVSCIADMEESIHAKLDALFRAGGLAPPEDATGNKAVTRGARSKSNLKATSQSAIVESSKPTVRSNHPLRDVTMTSDMVYMESESDPPPEQGFQTARGFHTARGHHVPELNDVELPPGLNGPAQSGSDPSLDEGEGTLWNGVARLFRMTPSSAQ